MNRHQHWKTLSLSIILLCIACGVPDAPQYVARIGQREITVEEFKRRAQKLLKGGYRDIDTLDQQAKEKILDGLIAQELLIIEGIERGFSRDSTIVEEVERVEQKALIDTLYARQALKKQYIFTRKELEQFFKQREYDIEVHSKQIVCATEEEAWETLRAIQAGGSFADLAPEHSLRRIREKFGEDGDIGWFKMGEMLSELQQPVRTMEAGSLYPRPVKSHLGFHIFKLVDRRSVALDSVRTWVEQQLKIKQRASDKAAYVRKLRQQYALQTHDEALSDLLTLPPNAKYWPEEDNPLFTWKEGQLTIRDYLAMHRRGRVKHPASLDSTTLHKIADNLAGHRIMKTEARRLGYDRNPRIIEQIERKRNGLVVKRLFTTEGKVEAEPTEEEIRAHYQKHIDQFTRADGKVTDFDAVRGGIHRLLRQSAENQAMDRLIENLREKHRDQTEIHPERLADIVVRRDR
jgi:peptidyl-prolyl cis-trans isomerase C